MATINDISILKHLKINRSHYGEIHISEVVIPEEYQRKDITQERRELIEESLIQFQGNIFPIIVRELSSDKYELVYGVEVCQIIQDFVKTVGEKRALELNISRIRVYSIDIETNDIPNFRKTLEKIMNYKSVASSETEENPTQEKKKKEKNSSKAKTAKKESNKQNKKKENTKSDIQVLNEHFKNKEFKELVELLNSGDISKSVIHQFILSHYEFDNFMNLRSISLDFESPKDKMIQVIKEYTESNLS